MYYSDETLAENVTKDFLLAVAQLLDKLPERCQGSLIHVALLDIYVRALRFFSYKTYEYIDLANATTFRFDEDMTHISSFTRTFLSNLGGMVNLTAVRTRPDSP